MVAANIVAILLISSCFFFFIIFMIFVSASAGSSETMRIPGKSVLVLDQELKIIEDHSALEVDIFDIQAGKNTVTLHQAVEAIKRAEKDPDIQGISIETDGTAAGLTQIDAVRRAVENFKKSGKFVYSYGNVVSQKGYLLGSVADKYILNPVGAVEFTGYSLENYYLKDFLDKYGIGVDVIRHGKFKAAVEPFLRQDISPENREQLELILNDFWKSTVSKISSSRKLPESTLNLVADSLYGVIPEKALSYKLVDGLAQRSQYVDMLKKKINQNDDKELNAVSLTDYAKDDGVKLGGENQIAVLHATGEIMNGKGSTGIYSDDFVEQIREVKKNKSIKAVVLRVNSPGGSANAADEILYELKELQKTKPITVSFGDYAASGGYYIAMTGSKIFAEPNTLTGSIGVFGVLPNAKTLAERNGIKEEVVQTHANSAYYTPLGGLSEGGRHAMQNNVENTYRRFVGFVMQDRHKSFAEVDAIGGGRVWSGQQALKIGLVDQLGSLEDAIAHAAKSANLKDYQVIELPGEKNPWERFFKIETRQSLAMTAINILFGEHLAQRFSAMLNSERMGALQMRTEYQLR